MNKRSPLPKQYWIYIVICIIFGCLLFGNIIRTDSWTGDMPFSEFTQKEWKLFMIFVVEELIFCFVMIGFALLAGKIYKKREQEIIADRERNKFVDINPGGYDYVWFDFRGIERALILKQNEIYILKVHAYDDQSGKWENIEHAMTRGKIILQVKNNIAKFEGDDFVFQLTKEEWEDLRCKNFTSSWGGSRYLPLAFTEQGIYMLMTVLRGDLAIKRSRALIRTLLKNNQLLLN